MALDAPDEIANVANTLTHPRHVHDYVQIGFTIGGRWVIQSRLGRGSFGQVYACTVKDKSKEAAIKISPQDHKGRLRLLHESKILQKAAECPHIVKCYDYGIHGNFEFLVMEKLGPDLKKDLFSRDNRCYKPLQVMYIGLEMLSALRELHSIGYVHNDVKPSNFAMSLADNAYNVRLFDFGSATKLNYSNQRRKLKSVRGTIPYLSVNSHHCLESKASDDLYGLVYSLIELAKGSLPWTCCMDPNRVLRSKLEYSIHKEMGNQLIGIKKFYDYLGSSDPNAPPDYEIIEGYFLENMRDLVSSIL